MIGLLALCIVNSLNYIYYIFSIILVQLDFKRIKAMLHFDYCDAALPVCIIYCKSLYVFTDIYFKHVISIVRL